MGHNEETNTGLAQLSRHADNCSRFLAAAAKATAAPQFRVLFIFG